MSWVQNLGILGCHGVALRTVGLVVLKTHQQGGLLFKRNAVMKVEVEGDVKGPGDQCSLGMSLDPHEGLRRVSETSGSTSFLYSRETEALACGGASLSLLRRGQPPVSFPTFPVQPQFATVKYPGLSFPLFAVRSHFPWCSRERFVVISSWTCLGGGTDPGPRHWLPLFPV